jgi:hypothetical protein
VGCIFGSVNSRADIPRLLNLYADGLLDLDGMVTTTYALEDINAGHADMHAGRNIRGVLVMLRLARGYRSDAWRAGRPSFLASGFHSWTKASLSLVALLSKGMEAA